MKTAIDSTIDSSVEIGFRAAVGATALSRSEKYASTTCSGLRSPKAGRRASTVSAKALPGSVAANSSATSMPATTFPSHLAWRRHALRTASWS